MKTNGANSADFLILSSPSDLTILNHFEQTVSADEKKQIILPYSPLQIIEKNTTLGDQITEALRFEYKGKTWFIQKNEKGNFAGLKQGYQKTFQKCELINDTVTLTKSIRIYEQYPSSGKFSTVSPGSVERVFKFQNCYYVYSFENPQKYGWYSGASSVFEKKKTVSKSSLIQSDFVNRIESRLKTINEMYTGFFGHFNDITNQQKSIPVWTTEKSGSVIKCKLVGSVEIVDQLEMSTQYVVQEIRQILAGKPYMADYQNGEIIIRQTQGTAK
ncbi:MAG: hypothetical protein Q4F84_01490 [Fibrobacter sp.]|nr:hypothetical protein [Fibrobacter sp.]